MNWRKVAERINGKTDTQCRNFYKNFRKKYGLETVVQEFKKVCHVQERVEYVCVWANL